jgi:hypothetical protein
MRKPPASYRTAAVLASGSYPGLSARVERRFPHRRASRAALRHFRETKVRPSEQYWVSRRNRWQYGSLWIGHVSLLKFNRCGEVNAAPRPNAESRSACQQTDIEPSRAGPAVNFPVRTTIQKDAGISVRRLQLTAYGARRFPSDQRFCREPRAKKKSKNGCGK